MDYSRAPRSEAEDRDSTPAVPPLRVPTTSLFSDRPTTLSQRISLETIRQITTDMGSGAQPGAAASEPIEIPGLGIIVNTQGLMDGHDAPDVADAYDTPDHLSFFYRHAPLSGLTNNSSEEEARETFATALSRPMLFVLSVGKHLSLPQAWVDTLEAYKARHPEVFDYLRIDMGSDESFGLVYSKGVSLNMKFPLDHTSRFCSTGENLTQLLDRITSHVAAVASEQASIRNQLGASLPKGFLEASSTIRIRHPETHVPVSEPTPVSIPARQRPKSDAATAILDAWGHQFDQARTREKAAHARSILAHTPSAD